MALARGKPEPRSRCPEILKVGIAREIHNLEVTSVRERSLYDSDPALEGGSGSGKRIDDRGKRGPLRARWCIERKRMSAGLYTHQRLAWPPGRPRLHKPRGWQ